MKYIGSIDDFKKIFSKNLYNKIMKETSIAIFRKDITKEVYNEILEELYYELINNTYKPSCIDETIYSYKTNNVARIIPVFAIKDELLYYFLCKMIENEIAVNRTVNTYGGWLLGNKIKLEEDSEIDYVYKSYNPTLWNENWKLFQNILIFELNDLNEDDIIIKLDIANFYDNINLDILEKMILSELPREKLEYIYLLFYLLKSWNLKNDVYSIKTVGIPQNEFGDQSRLLANFYLQNYDESIKNICDLSNAKYIRYADDQIIILKNIEKENNIMYVIARELNLLGLNLNASKVKKYNKETIKILYGIPIFKLLDENKLDEACDLFFRYKENTEFDFNYTSSLKRFLNIGLKNFCMSNSSRIKAIITEYQFVKESNSYYMEKIYYNLSSEEQQGFIELIYKIAEESKYNSFHYNAINFLKKINKEENFDKLLNLIKDIKNI